MKEDLDLQILSFFTASLSISCRERYNSNASLHFSSSLIAVVANSGSEVSRSVMILEKYVPCLPLNNFQRYCYHPFLATTCELLHEIFAIYRLDACPCNSGKKYKKCCGI